MNSSFGNVFFVSSKGTGRRMNAAPSLLTLWGLTSRPSELDMKPTCEEVIGRKRIKPIQKVDETLPE